MASSYQKKTETAEESKQTIKNSPSNAKSILQNKKKKETKYSK